MTRAIISVAVGIAALILLLVGLAAVFPAVGDFYASVGVQLQKWGVQMHNAFSSTDITVKNH
jgi:hypothetical protein